MKWEHVLVYIQLGQSVENEQEFFLSLNMNINSRISNSIIKLHNTRAHKNGWLEEERVTP